MIVGVLLVFLTRLVLAFFALQISLIHTFALARFRFFWRRCSFFCHLLTHTHPYRTASLFLPLYSSEWSSLVTMTIPAHFLFFFVVCMHYKICLPRPFVDLFFLFLLRSSPMHPFAPIRIDLHPFASIHTTFRQTPKNIMSGENSPAIGPKSYPAWPLMPPACLVFVFLVPPVSQRTHAHPYAPIQTHSYPCSH